MKKSFTLLFALFFCVSLFAQSFWERASGPNGLNIETLKYSAQGVFYATDYKDRTYRSVDVGLSWEEIKGPVTGLEIRRLEVGYNGTLYCVGTDWVTIYRSANLGDTWDKVSNPYYSSAFTEAADGGFLVSVEGSILRTYDDLIWDTLYLNPNPWGWNAEIRELGWLPDGTLVASPDDCYDSFSGNYFLISQNNGSTWDSLPGAGPIANLAALGNSEYIFSCKHFSQMVFKTSIGSASPILLSPDIISPQEEDFVVTSSGSIIVSDYYKSRISDDGGNTWQAYEGNVFFSFSTRVLPGNLLLRGRSYDGNIARSIDLGKTWKFSGYGVENAWVHDWTFKGSDKAFGLSSSGVWRSMDTGEHWQIVLPDSATKSFEFSVYNLEIAPNGDLYVMRPYLLQRSTDDGETFQNISPDSSLGNFARVAVHPQTGDLFMVRDTNFVRSSDQGQTWQAMNPNIRFSYQPIAFHPSGTFYGIALNPNGPGSNLVRSDDNGDSWQIVALNPLYNLIEKVQIAPNGKIVANYGATFYISEDNGDSWKKSTAPLDVLVLEINTAGDIYIGDINSKRIFVTKDNGSTWSALLDIPSTSFTGIVELAFDSNQRLWVCTDGDGHFKTLETTVSTSQAQARDYALEVFPNPAEGGFWINWDSEKSEMPITVILRDLCGRVITHQTLNSAPAYVSVADIVPGLYTLELNKNGERIGLGKVFLK
ncbi:MAG: YCF48-related protein [Saprospiraceae bacterium]|nr:YCF48-related protein [Saprospiraceae bacterium]